MVLETKIWALRVLIASGESLLVRFLRGRSKQIHVCALVRE